MKIKTSLSKTSLIFLKIKYFLVKFGLSFNSPKLWVEATFCNFYLKLLRKNICTLALTGSFESSSRKSFILFCRLSGKFYKYSPYSNASTSCLFLFR